MFRVKVRKCYGRHRPKVSFKRLTESIERFYLHYRPASSQACSAENLISCAERPNKARKQGRKPYVYPNQLFTH